MSKVFLITIALAAFAQASIAQQSSIEEQINQTLRHLLKLEDMPLVRAERHDLFAIRVEPGSSTQAGSDEEWLLRKVQHSSAYSAYRPTYEIFVRYEALMVKLSSLVRQADFEELVASEEDPSAKLLLRIADDRIKNWEHYREIFEFYSDPRWTVRGIPKSADEQKTELRLSGRDYKYAWVYYLYAPEIRETRIINMPFGYENRILRTLAKIDGGEAYPFVLRQMNSYMAFVQKSNEFETYRNQIASAVHYYLIKHPNETSLNSLQDANRVLAMNLQVIKGSPFDSTASPPKITYEQDLAEARNFGRRFAFFIKSKHAEQRVAWERLFEEADQDRAFVEFLKGYRSNI